MWSGWYESIYKTAMNLQGPLIAVEATFKPKFLFGPVLWGQIFSFQNNSVSLYLLEKA